MINFLKILESLIRKMYSFKTQDPKFKIIEKQKIMAT